MSKQSIPAKAVNHKQISDLPRDNISTPNSWIMIDTSLVYIRNQKKGKESTGGVVLSRSEFKKFAEWYFGIAI